MTNVYTGEAIDAWQDVEADRLRSMQGLVGSVARQDLVPLISRLQTDGSDSGSPLEFIDLGAGPDRDVENLVGALEAGYTAYDGNPGFLDARREQAIAAGIQVDPARLILGRLEDMSGLPDARYTVSYSRAATAWSADADATIREQLRITNRAAVFTEYDWTAALVRGEADNNVSAAGLAAKSAMIATLEAAGFNTRFGAELPERVRRVAEAAGFVVGLESVRHELPEGDHRELFVDAANTLLAQLDHASSDTKNAVAAAKAQSVSFMLRKCLRVIQDAPQGTVRVRLPALVTTVARILDKSEDLS